MSFIEDNQNVSGIINLLNDGDDGDFDYNKLEREILNNTNAFEEEESISIDHVNEFTKSLNGMDFINNPEIQNSILNTNDVAESSSNDIFVSSSLKSSNSADGMSGSQFDSSDIFGSANFDDDEDEDESDEESVYEHSHSSNREPAYENWSNSNIHDRQLKNMTVEEQKQKHINGILGGITDSNDDANLVNGDAEDDEMARIHEQIDVLRSALESEGVDLSRIPNIGSHSSRKEATSVLKMLQIKNDRLRYCDMFEEGILAVAYGMESMFDGQKEWFGSKIDLVGWPETVKVKIRRMRYDTSSFVSNVMQGYQISHGWRILFELLPSLFLYSRDRRLKNNDTLVSDSDYKNAVSSLNQ